MAELRVLAIGLVAFGLGAIPFGWLLGRLRFGTDIRQLGSQNIGATNVARTLGVGAGLVVLLLDAAKAFFAIWIAEHFGHSLWLSASAGTLAVMGHIYSPFLAFKGGKGVAAGLGAALALVPLAGGVAIFVFAVTAYLFQTVSIASGLGILAVVGTTGLVGKAPTLWAFAVPTAAVTLWAHRANWRRLGKGLEPRFRRSTK